MGDAVPARPPHTGRPLCADGIHLHPFWLALRGGCALAANGWNVALAVGVGAALLLALLHALGK